MAEGLLTMFGKTYNTVGSADTNLVLLTKGDLKIRWGNKFIDLIKNGKINVDTDVIKLVKSKDEIYKDGIYLILKEEGTEIWMQVNGELVNIQGEIGTTYVSFIAPQEVTSKLLILALENIGFYYNTFAEATAANIEYGLVYCRETGKLYTVNNGELTLYNLDIDIPNPLQVGLITINGTDNRIYSKTDLNLGINANNYITMATSKISFLYDSLFSGKLQSDDFNSGASGKGFGIYNDNDTSILEIDKVIIRLNLTVIDYEEVTYSKLHNLINTSSLIEGRKYIIIDFLNEWEITQDSQTYTKSTRGELSNGRYSGHDKNVWPLIFIAKNSNTLETKGYFYDNPDWIVEYDPSFWGVTKTVNKVDELGNIIYQQDGITPTLIRLFSKGRITKLTDEKGNTANYDFKHRTFRVFSQDISQPLEYDEEYAYTFNTVNDKWWRLSSNNNQSYQYYLEPFMYEAYHKYADASQIEETCVNNTIYLEPPTLEDLPGEEVKEVVLKSNFIVINTPTYGNDIECIGQYLVNGPFFNNKVKLIQNIDNYILYTFRDVDTFTNNNISNFYAKGSIGNNDTSSEILMSGFLGNILDGVQATEIYKCSFATSSLTNVKFMGTIYNTFFYMATLSDTEFLNDLRDTHFEENSIIRDTIFKGVVLELWQKGEINRSIFQGINDVTIKTGAVVNDSSFSNLSEEMQVGTLSYVKIYDPLTPTSAVMREDENDITILVPIETLLLDDVTIPRLGGLGTKECHVVNREYEGNTYRTFVVSLSSEDTTPSGIIAMYSGLANNIPAGWVICDGTNGTPDLRGRFIRMISQNEAVGPKNNSDLETNGAGTRLAYLKKSIKHTHTYNSISLLLNVNLSSITVSATDPVTHSLTVDASGATVLGGSVKVYGSTGTPDFDKPALTENADHMCYSNVAHNHNMSGTLTVTGTITLPLLNLSGTAYADIDVTPTLVDDADAPTAINVEPQAYALIFIMKL